MNNEPSQPKINLSERFPKMRPLGRAPSLITFNGIGVTMYGRRDLDPETRTYIKTHCFCFVYIPLLALGAYRVADGADRTWYFLGREPLSRFAKGWNIFILWLVLVGGLGIGWNAHVSSPEYIARKDLQAAKEQLSGGDALKAANGFRKLTSAPSVSTEARAGLGQALEKCLLSDRPATVEGAFRILGGLSERVRTVVPDAFMRGLEMVEKQRAADTESALGLFEAVSTLEPKNELLPPLHVELLKQSIAARPDATNRVVELALIYENSEQLEACHKLLLPYQAKLGATEGARILGRHLLQEGKHGEAYGLLYPYVQTRLVELHRIERAYTNAAAAAYRDSLEYLRQGKAPRTFYSNYDLAAKDRQEEMVSEFIQARMKADPVYTKALANLMDANRIVHVTLDLGIVQLNRAQDLTDPAARKTELEEAERTFLAIRGLAGETDEYRMFLGQVYYWLGRSMEGRDLFDQLLVAKNRDYLVLMSLASTLREVGEWKQAHDLLEEAYGKGKSPQEKYAAASVRAASSREIRDKIAWLEKTDTSTAEAQVALNAARGELALEQGQKELAAQHFRKAIDGYQTMGKSSAVLNNMGLACLNLFEATGRLEDQDRGISLIEQAVALEPGHSILLINLSHILASRALADVSREGLRLDLLKESPGVNGLSILYNNDEERSAIYGRLRANENMKKSLGYLDKALLLAPKDRGLYEREVYLLAGFEDLGELQKLQQRLRGAQIGIEESQRELKEALSGEKDKENLDKVHAQLKKYEALLQSPEVKQHPRTHVYVMCMIHNLRASARVLGEQVDGNQMLETANAAALLHPCAATSSCRINACYLRAFDQLAKGNAEFATLVRSTTRILSPGYLVALLLDRGGPLASLVRENSDVKNAFELQKESRLRYKSMPSVEHWAGIRSSDPAGAASIAASYREKPFARLLDELQYELSPLGGSAVLDAYWARKMAGDDAGAKAIYQKAIDQGLPLPPLGEAGR